MLIGSNMWLTDISLLSATFNRHLPTIEMLESFYKHSKYLMNFYILDNSVTTRLDIESTDECVILDNCNYKHTPNYEQPSKNHCSSLMWAFTQIKTRYVLLCDNDILFKPFINEWLECYHNYDCIGEIGYDIVPPNRLFPYCCIIDLNFVSKHNISYFDNNRCMDQYGRKDTGSSFYDDLIANHANILNTKISNVCVHLKGATLHDKNLTRFYEQYNSLRG